VVVLELHRPIEVEVPHLLLDLLREHLHIVKLSAIRLLQDIISLLDLNEIIRVVDVLGVVGVVLLGQD